MSPRRVAVNDIGRRVGQDHHNAKLTDHDIDLLFALRDAGWGYKRLAAKFEISKRHVRDVLAGKRRGQAVAGFRSAGARKAEKSGHSAPNDKRSTQPLTR